MDIKKHKSSHWFRAIERLTQLFMMQHEVNNKEERV